ncbi:hypothetical protein [Desulfolithobacter sp.]
MVVIDTLIMIGYACLASHCVQWFRQQRVVTLIERVFALVIITTGLLLATTNPAQGLQTRHRG